MKRRFFLETSAVLRVMILGLLVFSSFPLHVFGSSSWNLQRLIQHYLETHYPWSEIEVLEVGGDVVNQGEGPEKIHLLQGPLGKAVFLLTFSSGRKETVEARVRAMDWAVVSRRPLKKGQIIDKEDVYLSLVDVRHLPKGSLTRKEMAWSKSLTRSVGANVPLVETDVSEPPLVKKGQKVLLVAFAPGLRITTYGEAREDGYAGRQIKVLNLDSKKNVRGTLVDANQVKVDF